MKAKFKIHFLWAFLLLVILYAVLYKVIGQGLFSHSDYDSYTRQAAAWWSANANLPQDVSWLEIATYNGQYFVSFPPFPGVIQFLLYPVFGMATPDNLVNTLFGLGSFIIIYFISRRKNLGDFNSAVLALLMVLGSNVFYLSLTGWVWFSAQVQGFFFSALAVYLITSKRKTAWYFAFFALGAAFLCRPFQILYFPLMLYLLYKNIASEKSIIRTLGSCIKYVLPLMFVGALGAAYNYIRFDSIFEFGHNYLPEFANEPQFGLSYISSNFLEILKLPTISEGALVLPKFNGTLFFLVNPVYILLAVSLFRQKFGAKQLIYLMCLAVHFLLMLAHKTMGGWQFGSRYLVDMIPFMVLMILDDRVLIKNGIERKVSVLPVVLAVLGPIINVYGAVWFYTAA
jgi:hypothetical protein